MGIPDLAVTFRLSIDQFRSLLLVVMDDAVSDHLSNAVLMACTRPHAGIISVPLPRADGVALVEAVDRAVLADQAHLELAELIRNQLTTTD
jgi:hypothetical protein